MDRKKRIYLERRQSHEPTYREMPHLGWRWSCSCKAAYAPTSTKPRTLKDATASWERHVTRAAWEETRAELNRIRREQAALRDIL